MTDFQQKLTRVLNETCQEAGSNTPDFILAAFLGHCLTAFNVASRHRERWYGKALRIGDVILGQTDDAPPMIAAEWSPAEAIFAFAGWLTSRPERTILSAQDDAAPVLSLIDAFCTRHKLDDPRPGWDRAIVPDPESQPF